MISRFFCILPHIFQQFQCFLWISPCLLCGSFKGLKVWGYGQAGTFFGPDLAADERSWADFSTDLLVSLRK